MVGLRPRRADCRQLRRVPAPRGGRLEVARLDDRDELHVRRADFATQEAVDIERTRRVVAMHAGQRVERHAVPLEQSRTTHHLIEGRLLPLRRPHRVVHVLGAVDRQPHQEAVLLEEPRPVVVEQRAVGLQVVLDALPDLRVFPLQGHRLFEPLHAEQRRFPALPREDHLVARHALDVVADEGFQDLFAHSPETRHVPPASPCSGSSSRCNRGCRPSPRAWP